MSFEAMKLMIMCKLVAFLTLFAMLCGGTAAGQDDGASKKAARAGLKLMSFNIRYYKPGADGDNCWENRREGVLKMLRAESPDIVGFQEPHRPQVDFLKVNMSDYATLDMGVDSDANIVKSPDGGAHLMIMYRKARFILLDSGFFWLSDTPGKPSRGWDAVCRRVTVWGKFRDRRSGKEFYYFDTHFDHKGMNARMHEARMMAAKMKEIAGEKAAVIMSGDLNTTFGNEALAPLREWMSGARETAPVTDSLPTFNGWGAHDLRIDHIFYRRVKVAGYESLVNDAVRYGVPYLSDHNPIVAWFKL